MTTSCYSETNDSNECSTSSTNSFFFVVFIHKERPVGSLEGLLLGMYEEADLCSSRA